jgi:alpha-L-fucosidase
MKQAHTPKRLIKPARLITSAQLIMTETWAKSKNGRKKEQTKLMKRGVLRISIPPFATAMLLSLLFRNASWSQQHHQVLPTPEQLAWADAEIGVIIHLDINIYAPDTFDYRKTETLPTLDVFNPARLNTDQWMKTAKAAGAKYAVLTVKHGTGFCLWPSKVNNYNVGHTKWKQGKGDILKDFIASCKKYGLKPGLYYNTNSNTYYGAGYRPFVNDGAHLAYNKAVLQQLQEIWHNYGELFEIWFDGGINADSKTGIQTAVMRLIAANQPHAILFQGPAGTPNIIRWCGNEDGIAAYPQWSRTNITTASDGSEKIDDLHGDPQGKYWCPAESDYPIRRNNAWNGGWLWHSGQDNSVFTIKELVSKYEKSVGRNTNMLIGMAVNTDGLIPKRDSLAFDSLGKKVKDMFMHPVAAVKNSNLKTILVQVNPAVSVTRVVIQETTEKGENIRGYVVEALVNHRWQQVAEGQSVGHKIIQNFSPVKTTRFRFRVLKPQDRPVYIRQIIFYH